MILLFDLDRTIIDTEKFKRGLSKIFGLSLEESDSQVNEFFRKTGVHYSPEAHINVLKKIGHIKNKAQGKETSGAYKKLTQEIDKYIFPETEKILSHLKKQGHKLILITLGTPSSQKRKIAHSCIKKYFDKIIYESKSKSENKFIKSLSKTKEDILIINDKASEALEIKKVLGDRAKIFLVNGPHSKNVEHQEKIYEDISKLQEALNFVI